MCGADRVWITELTSIHKNIIQRSVHNSHVQVYQSIWWKTHYDVTDKNNNVSSEGLERQYHKYPSSYIGLAEILAIISVSALNISVILYLSGILTFFLWSHRLILSVSIDWFWYWEFTVSVTSHYDVVDKNNNVRTEGFHRHYITNITVSSIGLALMLPVMYVSTFITAVILYISCQLAVFLEETRVPGEDHWPSTIHR